MATIRDVARASNVSTATVSRVFNNSPLVSEETRQRVVTVAQSLGYWPNGIARSLITARTHTLGALLPDLHGEFFSEVIHGIDLAARERGFHLLVSKSSSSPEELTEALRSMRGRVDGVIVMAPDLDVAEALHACPPSLRVMLLEPQIPLRNCDALSINNFEGARIVVRHLLGLGHRTVAMIRGPGRNIDARQREDGYHAALAEAGLPLSPVLEFQGDFTERSGFEAALELLRREPRPSAVFVANDHMAVGAMGAFQEARVRVPEDIAVAGFDDIELARFMTPPLTTVHVDMIQLGRRAVEMLLDSERRAPGPGTHELLATTLVVRGSCGAVPPGRGDGGRWDRGERSVAR
jgi:LacI family transcriptional regulator, galactose operon repressor